MTRAGSGVIGTTTADGSGAWSLRPHGDAAAPTARTRSAPRPRAAAAPARSRRRSRSLVDTAAPAGRLRQPPEPRGRHQQRRQHHLPRHLQRARDRRRRRRLHARLRRRPGRRALRRVGGQPAPRIDVTVGAAAGRRHGAARRERGRDRHRGRRRQRAWPPASRPARSSRGCWWATAPGCAASAAASGATTRTGATASWAAAPGNTANFSTPRAGGRRRRSSSTRRARSATWSSATPIRPPPASWIVDDDGDPAERADARRALGHADRHREPAGRRAPASLWPRPWRAPPGLTKLGPGTLVLDRPNTLSGPLNVNGGTLRLDRGRVAQHRRRDRQRRRSPAGVHLHVDGGSLAAGGLVTIGADGGGNARAVHARLGQRDASPPCAPTPTPAAPSGSTAAPSPPPTSTSAATARPPWTSTPASSSPAARVTVGTMGLGTNNSNGALTVAGGTLDRHGRHHHRATRSRPAAAAPCA